MVSLAGVLHPDASGLDDGVGSVFFSDSVLSHFPQRFVNVFFDVLVSQDELLAHQSPDDFPHRDGSNARASLFEGEDGGARQPGRDARRRLACRQGGTDSGQGCSETVLLIVERAVQRIHYVLCPEAGPSGGRASREGSQRRDDVLLSKGERGRGRGGRGGGVWWFLLSSRRAVTPRAVGLGVFGPQFVNNVLVDLMDAL